MNFKKSDFLFFIILSLNLIISILILDSCGVDSFKGDNTKFSAGGVSDVTQNDEDAQGKDNENILYENLLWLWNCDDNSSNSNIQYKKTLTIKGNGIHKIQMSSVQDTQLYIQGMLCVPPSVERNIVFVVDVSKSMTSSHGGLFGLLNPPSDPVVGISCGRLNAIEKLLDSFQNTNAKYSIVTFSDTAIDISSKFFDKEQDLLEDLLNKSSYSNILDIICAGYSSTNYNQALNAAKNLILTHGSNNALKEIYFISDGQPDPENQNGIDIAKELKNYTNIGTIMLGSAEDKVMREYIASIDIKTGLPLHVKVNNADQLAEALLALSKNIIQFAEIWYKGKHEKQWTKINILQQLEENDFSYKGPLIDSQKYPNGIELIYKYGDRFNHTWEYRGVIEWVQ